MLIYLLRLSDMINTVLLLRHVTVALFKVLLMDYTERFSSLTIHFHEWNYERNLFLSKLFQFFTRNSKAKLVYIAILFSLDFMLERKGADGKRLRDITETSFPSKTSWKTFLKAYFDLKNQEWGNFKMFDQKACRFCDFYQQLFL